MTFKLNISFIGGCLITQKNIPKESRFFSIFKENMASDLSIETSLSFANYSNFNQLEESVLKLLAKKKTDILIIHIRPQPFLFLTKFLIRGHNPIFSLNPLLFDKRKLPLSENEKAPIFNQLVSKPLYMGINIFLGRLFQLNKIASELLYSRLENLHAICAKNKIKLFILGISPQPMTKQGNINCRKLNNYLVKKYTNLEVSYVDTFEKLNKSIYYDKDGVHLSKLGHVKLGEILFEGIKKGLESI